MYVECDECKNYTLMWLKEENVKKKNFSCGFCAAKKMEAIRKEMEERIEKIEIEARGKVEEIQKRMETGEKEAKGKEEKYQEKEKRMEEKIGEQKDKLEKLKNELKEERMNKERKWSDLVKTQEKIEVEWDRKKEEHQKEWEKRKEESQKEWEHVVRKDRKDIRTVVNKVEREKNIIIRGLEEGKEELEDMKTMLEEVANERAEEGVGKKIAVRIKRAIRKGERNETRGPRPLKVELENGFQAYKILRGKANLKNKGEEWSRIFIDEDLNWEERRQRVELRKEMKELRQEGIYCFIEGE